MRDKSTKTTLLVLTILLCLLVIGLGAYTYSFYNKVKENESELLKDKALIEAELDEEIARYNMLLEEKNELSAELSIAKERLEAFQKRIDSNEVTRSIVRQYQEELKQLRKEQKSLFRQNDSLQQETRRLSDLQERTQNSLDSITKQRVSVPINTAKEKKSIASKITISNMQVYGVIQRNSGKFVNTSRAARAQMARICYEVDANDQIPASELTFYVRVVNDKNKLVGVERFVTLSADEQLSYNAETSIDYQNKSYKICELVLPVSPFSKGTYTVEIYSRQGLISTTILNLK